MARAFSGELTVAEHYQRALREIAGVLDNLEHMSDLMSLADEDLADHFIKPKNGGGGWEIAPLHTVDLEDHPVGLDHGVTASGQRVPLMLVRIGLDPHPSNETALKIRSERSWPTDTGIEVAASFDRARNLIELRGSSQDMRQLLDTAHSMIRLINAEISKHTPEFQHRVMALIAEHRSRTAHEAAELARVSRELGFRESPAKVAKDRVVAEKSIPPTTKGPQSGQPPDPKEIDALVRVVATLTAMRSHAPESVDQSIARQYDEQLNLLEGLGHDVRGWRVPDGDLRPFVYLADDYGNILSQSELRFINRSSFLMRLEPALEFAHALLDQQRTEENDRSSQTIAEKAEREVTLQTGRRNVVGNIVELMDRLLRDLIGIEERLDAISIPSGPRARLRRWIRTIDEGKLSSEAWTPMKNELEDLFGHVRENLEGDPSGFYSLPSVQQSLLSYDGYISSTMHDIEILQGAELSAGLEAFNASRRRANAGRSHKSGSSLQDATMSVKKLVVGIGHGHSELWRALKDYIEDDLELDTRYFEQSSHVGETTARFLDDFADAVDCAIIVLTRDDEQADGSERARQNAVHEVGFFQGRLGFEHVAMVIQRGVEEFSNVAGIFPIYFNNHQIKATFPDLAKWLKRENLIS